MKIATPIITNFNKDRLAPANEKLASFIVGQLPKNIMKPFMFISTSKLNITYQKLRDRYEYLRRLEPMTPCDPKCQEGWYWDCETETCKEYSSYIIIVTARQDKVTKWYNKQMIIETSIIAVDNTKIADCARSSESWEGLNFITSWNNFVSETLNLLDTIVNYSINSPIILSNKTINTYCSSQKYFIGNGSIKRTVKTTAGLGWAGDGLPISSSSCFSILDYETLELITIYGVK